MESFAFWYEQPDANEEKDEEKADVNAVVNINLWCECGWDKKRKKTNFEVEMDNSKEVKGYPYLDIGFKIENLKKASKICFFLPFPISKKNIQDLGVKFHDTPLVDAVFNESYDTTISSCKKTIDISHNLELQFKIYQLDIEHDVELTPFADGTIWSFDTLNIEKDEKNYPYYFRFRIKDCPLNFLIHQYIAPGKVLQSIFSTTYMIDFRFNNIRSLNNTLIERYSSGKNKKVAIRAVHFLLITKAYVEVSSGNFKSIRKIEPKVWEEYVNYNNTDDLVAYHYATKGEKNSGNEQSKEYIDSSELFLKFRVEKSFIPIYVTLTLLIGIVGSIIATIISTILSKLFFD